MIIRPTVSCRQRGLHRSRETASITSHYANKILTLADYGVSVKERLSWAFNTDHAHNDRFAVDECFVRRRISEQQVDACLSRDAPGTGGNERNNMSIHFLTEMDRLHRDILSMCSTVEENITEAVRGVQNRGSGLANELAVRDHEVNQLDIRIEEECLKILALYHPVANDLRRVAAVLKISGELERVGDLAVNIAERSASLSAFPDFPMPSQLSEMATQSLAMLHSSIDCYIEQNADAARTVIAQDDVVDEFNDKLIEALRIDMGRNASLVEPGMHLFSVIRHIERVADHASNIAEDVVYLISGEIIRHRGKVKT